MEITGEELYEAWWGAERNMLVRDIQLLPGYASYFMAKLYNHKFKPIEDGRFDAINCR